MVPDTASPGGQAIDQLDDRLDDVFDALAHAYRRFALVYLDGSSQPVSSRSLAVSLAEWDEGASVDRVHSSLHHAHLPKLESAGFVDYDDAVQLREEADRALAVLDAY